VRPVLCVPLYDREGDVYENPEAVVTLTLVGPFNKVA
jgi:hypothetical protein